MVLKSGVQDLDGHVRLRILCLGLAPIQGAEHHAHGAAAHHRREFESAFDDRTYMKLCFDSMRLAGLFG